jgi:hypothetical protein
MHLLRSSHLLRPELALRRPELGPCLEAVAAEVAASDPTAEVTAAAARVAIGGKAAKANE